ncbi:MAG: NADPH-dependent 7-cyano-7-deazaguanine reductase QueF [Gemmatimonadetes bacterium]|nr:NADPH-dependent 7-cyano-7-deazaguanine reductase QueF [Gemmatimonadota bacterium]|tara:strand:- start:1260 stop:1613 length:354 start_codon:yes stop_codon:yes gene_type:complete
MADRRDTIEVVENPERERDYEVSHATDEFTFLYPRTEQPCFANVEVTYIPADHCVEMMSLKQYLQTFRDETHFFEAVTNEILDDLAAQSRPKAMSVTARFTVRGGISSVVRASVKNG